MEKENENHQLETGFFVHHRIVSAANRVDFISDTVSYMDLRGCWCNIIVLNVHVPSKEKSDDSKDSFNEELEKVFSNHFPKYRMKILLEDLKAIPLQSWTGPEGSKKLRLTDFKTLGT